MHTQGLPFRPHLKVASSSTARACLLQQQHQLACTSCVLEMIPGVTVVAFSNPRFLAPALLTVLKVCVHRLLSLRITSLTPAGHAVLPPFPFPPPRTTLQSRGSAEGLSIAMFCLSVTANLCTGTSIVLRLSAWDTLKVQVRTGRALQAGERWLAWAGWPCR